MDIDAAQFAAIVGPSGCGKSSLLMMMAGLQHPTEGSIECNGQVMKQPDPSRIGVVFQDASLYPWLSARENVEFPLMLRGVDKKKKHDEALAALELVGLSEFSSKYPRQLSGGMKQRVSIARGLVQDPAILLLDEPFAALDEQSRMTMGDELLRIWSITKKTIVFVTHSLTEAVYLADVVYVMSSRPGRLVERHSVNLPRPRTYEMMSSEVFNRLRDRIWSQIRVVK
jgi:NitT/TauT family transport system ATP-binding protein